MTRSTLSGAISADQLALRVRFDWRGRVGLAIAALVGHDRAEAGVSERLHLMAPRVPQLGKAVAKDHGKAGAGLRHVHPDAVGFDEAMLDFAHFVASSRKYAGSCCNNGIEASPQYREFT
jgi:hypothetical protein